VPLTKVHGSQEEANEEVMMTAKTEAEANQRSHEMEETAKAKAGANRPSEELKETAKAAVGANRPTELLEEAVKPTTIPDPQDRPHVAEIPTTVTHRDAIGPGRNHLGPEPKRKTRKKALIISTATVRKMTEVGVQGAPEMLRQGLDERNALLRLVLDYATERASLIGLGPRFPKVTTTNDVKGRQRPEKNKPQRSRNEISQSLQRHRSRSANRSWTKGFFPNCLVGVHYDADLLDWKTRSVGTYD
jgi:hypothetical protein